MTASSSFLISTALLPSLTLVSLCLIQDSEGAEPKPLSLATLFGSKHHHSPKPDPVSPLATPLAEASAGRVTRPPVARTLTYEETMNSGRIVTSKGGNIAMAGFSDRGLVAVIGGQIVRDNGGNVVSLTPTTVHQHQQQQQQQQQNQPQHCPAIQKLMQGQRGVGGTLQTLSESPENRLCDNGVPLEHHHHHHMFHHHQQHHHHHHHQQQQLQQDPIKRLFQLQPLPPPASASTPFTSAAPCFSNPPPALQQNPHLSSHPIMVDTVSCSHLQAQQSQQMFFNLSKPQPEAQHHSQSASAIQGTGGDICDAISVQAIWPCSELVYHIHLFGKCKGKLCKKYLETMCKKKK